MHDKGRHKEKEKEKRKGKKKKKNKRTRGELGRELGWDDRWATARVEGPDRCTSSPSQQPTPSRILTPSLSRGKAHPPLRVFLLAEHPRVHRTPG